MLFQSSLSDSLYLYVETCAAGSKQGANPLDGFVPSVPEGEKFQLGTEDYSATEAIGMTQLGKVGFILVAGGLGERLGYNGTKVRERIEILLHFNALAVLL